MLKHLFKIILISTIMFNTFQWTVVAQETPPQDPPVKNEKSNIKLEISIRDGICRNTSPIMVDLTFKNPSIKPQKLCIYKFLDSLLRLDIKNSKGQKIDFPPKLVTAEKISQKDWINIPPNRAFKETISINKAVIDATGSRLAPDNYTVKASYESCSKFDATIPEEKIESNVLFLMVTE